LNNELAAFDPLRAQVTQFVGPAMEIRVDSKVTSDGALESARDVKNIGKRIEEKRKELVAPLNELVKRINSYAKKISEPLDDAEKHLKSQLVAWEQKLAVEREAERKRLEAAALAEEERLRKLQAKEDQKRKNELTAAEMFGTEEDPIAAADERQAMIDRDFDATQMTLSAEANAIEKNRVSGTQRVWRFQIMDERSVPREFCSPDAMIIREAVRNGVREIQGVRIYEDIQISVRS
jgi:hypothetical protein